MIQYNGDLYDMVILNEFSIHTQLLQLIKYVSYDLKEGDILLSLLFNFASEYAIRKVKENHKLLKFSGTHQVIIYADDVNLRGPSIHTVSIISPL